MMGFGWILISLLAILNNLALKDSPFSVVKTAQIDQYSVWINLSISASLSHINFNATDWTLPAEIEALPDISITAFHKKGLIL